MKLAMKLAIGLSLGGAAHVPAAAQDMGWSTIIPSVTGTDTLGLVLREQIGRGRPAGRPADAAPVGLRYTLSGPRRAQNMARIVARTRAVDKGSAEDLERLFANDFFGKLVGPLGRLGLRIDDLADAWAIWWISAWNAAHGSNDTPSPAVAQAVRRQAARALGAVSAIQQAGDADKQELAEALLVQMALIDTAVEQNRRDMAGLRVIHSAVIDGARKMGVDLETMTLTEAGFVPAP